MVLSTLCMLLVRKVFVPIKFPVCSKEHTAFEKSNRWKFIKSLEVYIQEESRSLFHKKPMAGWSMKMSVSTSAAHLFRSQWVTCLPLPPFLLFTLLGGATEGGVSTPPSSFVCLLNERMWSEHVSNNMGRLLKCVCPVFTAALWKFGTSPQMTHNFYLRFPYFDNKIPSYGPSFPTTKIKSHSQRLRDFLT